MLTDSAFQFDAPHPAPRFRFSEPIDDDALSDLIAEDARTLLRGGRPVELSRYLAAYPDLHNHEVSLDTAIEMTLQSMAQRGRRSLQQCAADLSEQFPALVDRIRIAAELSAAMNSTSLFNIISRCVGPVEVPGDFGPPLPDGRARYDLREILGQGSEGYVYLAVDRLLSDPTKPALAALKMLSERGAGSRRRLARHDEAVRARRVNHPNVIRAIDRGEWNSVQYAVFEYVQGNRLDTHAGQNRIAKQDAARIVAEVASGLQAIHLAGLIHCDLKPANVLMDSSGQARIADFGLAQYQSQVDADRDEFAAESSHGYGTLAFVAPEQYRRLPGCLAPAADIYALGGLLYWLLTGQAPNGATAEQARAKLNLDPSKAEPLGFPAALKIAPELRAICTRALSFHPRERYTSAGQLADDLYAFMALRPLDWARPGARHRLSLFARREPRVAALSALTLLGILAGGIGATWSVSHARALRAESELANLRAKEAKATQASFTTSVQGAVRSWMHTMDNLPTAQMSEQWLPVLTITESMGGPLVTNLDDDAYLWKRRIELSQQMKAEAAARGTEFCVEYLQWQLYRGFWLARAGRYPEALAELDANLNGWSKTAAAGDPYVIYAQATRDATEALGLSEQELVSQHEQVAGLRARLEKAEQAFAKDRRRDPVRKLGLEALVRISQPTLGGDPKQLSLWIKRNDQLKTPTR